MRNIKIKYGLGVFLVLALAFVGCQDDDASFGEVKVPTNVAITADVLCVDCSDADGDGTGLVDFVATSSGALAYKFDFGDGFSETNQTGKVTHRFTSVGVNTYTVVVNAVGGYLLETAPSIVVLHHLFLVVVHERLFLVHHQVVG